jgi:small subunit ribosomal protein S14
MITKEEQRQQKVAQGKYPKVRLRNRCSICGRPRGFHRYFGVCRLCVRKLAHEGKLPGVIKSSW